MSVAVPPTLEPLGTLRYASLGSAITPISDNDAASHKLDSTCNYALITVQTQPVSFTFDGTVPTATVGWICPAGTSFALENCRTLLAAMKMIETTASAVVTIAQFKGAS